MRLQEQHGLALVLAGGFSHRFGSDKRLHEIEGSKVLSRTVSIYASKLDTVVALRAYDDPASLFDSRLLSQIAVVRVSDSHLGMGHTLARGVLEAMDQPWLLVALGDMPFVKPETIRTLVNATPIDTSSILRPTIDGVAGHPVLFGCDHFAALSRLQGDQGAREVIKLHRDSVHTIECHDPGILKDIDTIQDVDPNAKSTPQS